MKYSGSIFSVSLVLLVIYAAYYFDIEDGLVPKHPQQVKSDTIVVAESRRDDIFYGSPSITKHNGYYYISHDQYGTGERGVVHIYRSKNLNKWVRISSLNGYWGTLFSSNNRLYFWGTKTEGEGIVIYSSEDSINWELQSSILGHFHTSPSKVLVYDKSFYKVFESGKEGNRKDWKTLLVKYDISKKSFSLSNFEKNYSTHQTIEGNIVSHEDDIKILSRQNCQFDFLSRKYDVKLETLRVNHAGYSHLPGAGSKFDIFRDAVSGYFILISNPGSNCGGNRNHLALFTSKDLFLWQYRLSLKYEEDTDMGFQYPSSIVDGDNLITAYRSATTSGNFHDANSIMIISLKDFRQYFRD